MLAASTATLFAWPAPVEPSSFQSQMMLLCGFVLLAWVLVRRTIRARTRGRREAADWKQQEKQATARVNSATPLANAPVEVLRWQSAMFDLQRDLKAELDTKISVVQAMVRLADQRIATLERLTPDAADKRGADRPATDESLPPT